jgi:hypothetical protein
METKNSADIGIPQSEDSLPNLNPIAPDLTSKKTLKKIKENTIHKEAKAIGSKVLDEGKAFGNAAQDIILGTRSSEIKNIRLKKVERNKEVYLER